VLAIRESRNAIGCQLVADALHSWGSAKIRVTGSSMLPRVLPGDVIVVERVQTSEVACGDIALFARDNRLFAHRVVEWDERHYRVSTSGDSLAAADPPITADELLGRVTSILRGHRSVPPAATLLHRIGSLLLKHSEFLTKCFLWMHSRTRSLREETEWT